MPYGVGVGFTEVIGHLLDLGPRENRKEKEKENSKVTRNISINKRVFFVEVMLWKTKTNL